jgi:hypothetical protein
MKKKIYMTLTGILLVSLLVTGTALATTIDPVNRTATTGNFFVDWSETNPERIEVLQWNGSANLTNVGGPTCTDSDNLEYFGNSWVSENEGTPDFFFGSLVGWGTTGTWGQQGSSKVAIESTSAGCFGSANIPISTTYQFFDGGAAANRIKVQRQFEFGATPYAHDVRPFIPRLYPMDGFTQVLHPDASGTALLAETLDGCDFGCQITDWDGTWFAIHDPTTGAGMIVRHAASAYGVALWVDRDNSSFTNASSVLLLQPPGGFTGPVSETEFLCFYDTSLWTPSLALPPGC